MRRLEDPADLGQHLAEKATAWGRILADVDASPLELFGRLEAVTLLWQALQRRVLTPFGINYAELATLGMLRTAKESRCSLALLRETVGQSSAGMTRILDKLVERGWVERENGGADRRRVGVRLTGSGAELGDRVHTRLFDVLGETQAQLERDERQALRSGLYGLLRAIASQR